jgi:site-specific DNA-methyltransferase (adenine-specific)
MQPTIHHGDCIEVMRTLPPSSVDAVVTDPPYELGFMGKSWDASGIANIVEMWSEVLRVLKPGGHVLSFGGTRTYHRMACAIEDAGFEIRDCLSWLYGSGFPKSLNLGDGRGTALKPGYEPIVLARKPFKGSVAATVAKHGTGALNVDACRIEGAKPDTTRGAGGQNGRYGPIAAQGRIVDDGLGRWPPNVLLDEEAAAMLDEQSGELAPGGDISGNEPSKPLGGAVFGEGLGRVRWDGYGGSGGASRFFFVARSDQECHSPSSVSDAVPSSSPSDSGAGSAASPVQASSTAQSALNPNGASAESAPSTSATQSESSKIGAPNTPPTLNTGAKCSPESEDERATLTGGPVNPAVAPRQTDTTTTTESQPLSGGCAVDAISPSTSSSLDLGAAGLSDAVRFRYVAKPSREERDAGCFSLPLKSPSELTGRAEGSAGLKHGRAGTDRAAHNHHPTVKPIELMRWLVKLVTPPGGTVLDPFMGSGTTGCACVLEQRPFIGIEREADYIAIAARRIRSMAPLFVEAGDALSLETGTVVSERSPKTSSLFGDVA